MDTENPTSGRGTHTVPMELVVAGAVPEMHTRIETAQPVGLVQQVAAGATAAAAATTTVSETATEVHFTARRPAVT